MATRAKRPGPTADDPEAGSTGGGQPAESPPGDPGPSGDVSATAESTVAESAPRRRRGRPPGSKSTTSGARASAVRPSRDPLTIEQIVAVESPREFRLEPRGRVVTFTAEAAGTQQLFTLSLRGGYPVRVTASEKPISEPQWSPDGRRLAFIRDGAIWIVEADGSREAEVSAHPAGNKFPRWAPDGLRLGFISRRRGWAQVHVVDAPVPRRGRPATNPRPPEPRALTPAGTDVDGFEWSPDGERIVVMLHPGEEAATARIEVVSVADGRSEPVATSGWNTGAQWMPDGSLLYLTDADGWFQVVRRSVDGTVLTVLTEGAQEHGEPTGSFGLVPLASPDGARFSHATVRDGFIDLVVAPVAQGPAKRGRGRPPKQPRPAPGAVEGRSINP